MTTMTAIFPHHWVVEEKDWNQVEKKPTQLSLLDFPEKELPFNLKDSKNWSEQNPKFQEKVILESGRDHFDIEFCKRIESCFNLTLHNIVQVLFNETFRNPDR